MRGQRPAPVRYVLAAGALIALMNAVVAYGVSVSVHSTPAGLYLFLMNLTYWTIWALFAPVVLWLGARARFADGQRARAFLVHASSSVAFGAAHIAAVVGVAVALRYWILGASAASTLRQSLPPTRHLLEWEITMYWALVGLAHALVFHDQARERALVAEQLRSRLAEARLQALLRQLQPHFLFNTLQTISALIHRDVAAADEMIDRLGELLRATLSAGDTPEVPLARELAHVRRYVAVEQVNMGSRLAVDVDVPSDLLACAVPVLLLQPLVENAVRHGLSPRASGGHVRIGARRSQDELELHVQDDGVGPGGTSSRSGIGIENARQRLTQLYGGTGRLTLESPPGGGFLAVARVPFRTLPAEAMDPVA